MKFTGKYDELRERLAALAGEGEWHDLNENQKQFRHRLGGILNWYPSTGTVTFQGPGDQKSTLESTVSKALSAHTTPTTPGKSEPERPPVANVVVPSHTTPAARPEAANRIVPAFLGQKYADSEIILGLVEAVGTEMKLVIDILAERLKAFNYGTVQVRVSTDVIPMVLDPDSVSASATTGSTEYLRISKLMDAWNEARKQCGDNSVLALGVAAKISEDRSKNGEELKPLPRRAYIIHSLKHPEEVARLREIYPEGFYLIGVHADEKRRHDHLTESKRLTTDESIALMRRDEDEHLTHGQRTSDTFHLSDFFVRIDENQDKLRNSVWRLLDVLFGYPHVTPTFDEYAMFMAFSAALRFSDLSRQVGAVVARNNEIIATVANDCPRFGGGLYWSEYVEETHQIKDAEDGRDYMRGEDANKAELQRIIDDILSRIDPKDVNLDNVRNALKDSRLDDITEFGRVVHAEMEALLSIARSTVSAVGGTLYATTFPCHNCAKHIVAAGVKRVVFIEPYPKSVSPQSNLESCPVRVSLT